MEIKFEGKRALVTGAASGIGRGIAVQLAKCGAKVVALDVNKSQLEKLKEDVPTIETINADLSDWKATKEAVKSVYPIDLLVNSAGVGAILPLTEVTEEKYDHMFNVNIKALINVTQTVIEDLLKRKSPGAIVNISSQASIAALPNHTLYCATKAAVDGFTRAVAMDFGPNKIRINCVNPTVVMTELGRRFWSDPVLATPMLAKIPLGRFGEIGDVAATVLFLLSDEASMITDLNAAELQYLADHLTPEECRRLVAAAHFKTYQEPNALDEAERKISKDLPCIDLLHHWNSQPGEGKGETHELLEHRLRQMGKYDLADWLGRTVFHDLAMDLNRSLEGGLHEFATEESPEEVFVGGPTLEPIVENSDPTEWTAIDTLLYSIMIGLIIVIVAICFQLCYRAFHRWRTNRKQRKVKFKAPHYEVLEADVSGSESEDKFDVRDYSENKQLIPNVEENK